MAFRSLTNASSKSRSPRKRRGDASCHRHLSIPDHRELDRGTLRKLIRDAAITVEEFLRLLADP